ncbi:unnamed protein product [Prunus armeniaca]
MAHLDSFSSPLIWHHPWFVATNLKCVLARIYWRVCRALAQVLAPPPFSWVISGSVSESQVGYVLRNVWLGLLTYGCLVLHGGDWWFVHLQLWSFSLLVAAAWILWSVLLLGFVCTVFYPFEGLQ